MKTFLTACLSVLLLGQITHSVLGEITIEGVQDKQVVTDRVTFRIVPADGATDTAELNGKTVGVGAWVEVVQPDFYELRVERAPVAGGPPETRVVRFIVRAAERGDTEWGLPPWTPFPAISSAPGEFAGAALRLVLPSSWPSGLELPVIARVESASGRPVPVNGTVSAEGFAAFGLRRGVGSAVLGLPSVTSNFTFTAHVGPLTEQRIIAVETDPGWKLVSGTITGTEHWAENSRIQIVSNLVLTAGAELRIAAGTVIKLASGVEIRTSGKLVVEGTSEHPVVFLPESRSKPWGGFVLRTNSAQLEMTSAILTGSGADPDWFGSNPGTGQSHRHEQPLLYLANGARAALTNCFLIYNQGQAAHGENAFLTMTDCLVQRCLTTGQFNGGAVWLDRSAFIEFPIDDDLFVDGDNDAIYFTEGTHAVSDCLIGWAKDDGIDAGSGGAGEVTVTGCWIESCYHEGLAWSGTGRIGRSRDTVIINCGQGVEAGWNSPDVFAENCLCLGNLIGARFGDNYDWTYQGFLRVTNSFLLFNYRNIWGRNWDDWTERLDRMDVQSNFVSAVDSNHLQNSLWSGEEGARLGRFLSVPAGSEVGVGFAVRSGHLPLSGLTNSIPIGLSRFSTTSVSVAYVAESAAGVLARGTVQFAPGETVKLARLSLRGPIGGEVVELQLRDPVNAAVTGEPLLFVPEAARNPKLIPAGAEWKYLDTGIEPPPDWRGVSFDDSSWRSGRAELGYGDGDETTSINGGPSTNRYSAAYFRRLLVVADPKAYSHLTVSLRRDDGAVVYLNQEEVFRSNMPTGLVTYATWALSASTSETAFFEQEIDPAWLLPGTNLIAVEVHQATRTSSDLSFNLELVGTPIPRLHFAAMPGGALWLYWDDPGLQLQEARDVTGPWQARSELATAVRVSPSTIRFYRLGSLAATATNQP